VAKSVIMPALGMAQETGTLLRWLKREGDAVSVGEPLLEIETDKATAQIEAPVSGTLRQIQAAEGDIIPVGQEIAIILQPGDSGEDQTAPDKAIGSTRPLEPDKLGMATETVALAHSRMTAAETAVTKQLASPKARRIAKQQGLELAQIKGSGIGGAILARDLDAAISPPDQVEVIEGKTDAPPSPPPSSAAAQLSPSEDQGGQKTGGTRSRETLPMSHNWRVMADRLSKGWTAIPHFYLRREVKVSEFTRWREEINSRTTTKVTVTDMLVRFVASSLSRHPHLNASWTNGAIELNETVNIGIAVGTADGLVVPVVHNAARLSFTETAERRTQLVQRARDGKLTFEDLSDGTFTISNLGMYGIDNFDPIVNPPQAAILAVGRVIEKVALIEEKATAQRVLNLTLACDHRVVDGVRGAEFLQSLVELIEDPIRILLYA
jgi:pyruvate dehydrogenase E2 component (dihydrolipoamide acetyltransferase)